jgi:hypothetical protein
MQRKMFCAFYGDLWYIAATQKAPFLTEVGAALISFK